MICLEQVKIRKLPCHLVSSLFHLSLSFEQDGLDRLACFVRDQLCKDEVEWDFMRLKMWAYMGLGAGIWKHLKEYTKLMKETRVK